jgi:hypothetical protein
MTIYEQNRRRWEQQHLDADFAWRTWRQYKPAVTMLAEVPKMLAALDADTETIDRMRAQNKALRDALHAAGGDPHAVLQQILADKK